MDVQWFPGHMKKTQRMIAEDLKYVDLVAEVVDARIPVSSRNPDVDRLTAGKPRLIVLNRADQADGAGNQAWERVYRAKGFAVLETNAKEGKGVRDFSPAVKATLKEQILRWREKGQVGRKVRVMVVGVPNVGKSTLINQIAGRRSAKAGDRPGVTRGKQWVAVDRELELLDTPGILWPKFEDPKTGLYLAFTGAVKDEIMDVETLGCHLMELLGREYPGALESRYGLSVPPRGEDEGAVAYGYRLLEEAARRRGFLLSGGELDTQRMANILLDEFRSGKLGHFTLELPEGMGREELQNG